MSDEADNNNDNNNKDNHNNNNGDDRHVDVDKEEEDGNANDVSNDPDAYDCALEEFGQNRKNDADANVEVEDENNAEGAA